MKVLISAYSCAPGEGSEPEAGLNIVLAAAQVHDVWVLFRADQEPRLRPFVEARGLSDRIHLEPIDIGDAEHAFSWSKVLNWTHYLRWQRKAALRANELDALHDFDLVHHATLASFYADAGVADLPKPMVWGPVGGGSRIARGLWRSIGFRGLVREAVRFVASSLVASIWRPPYKNRDDIEILVQNPATAKAVGRGDWHVLPNATSFAVTSFSRSDKRERTRDVLVVGRIYPIKGGRLAVLTGRFLTTPEARIVFIGDGPDQGRLQRAVRRLGLQSRVEFKGAMPRPEVIEAMRHAGALFHPAVRDESPFAVAEAMTVGTPLICVRGTGADALATQWPVDHVAISAKNPLAFARQAAAAIDSLLAQSVPIAEDSLHPKVSFPDEILRSYERAVERFARRAVGTEAPIKPAVT